MLIFAFNLSKNNSISPETAKTWLAEINESRKAYSQCALILEMIEVHLHRFTEQPAEISL